jgi:hypothetical protein
MRSSIVLASMAALLLPQLAYAATFEGYYGIARPPSKSLNSALEGVESAPDPFSGALKIAGGDILFHSGLLEVGAVGDVRWAGQTVSESALGVLGGVRLDMDSAWFDLLGEVGGHHVGNFARDPNAVFSPNKDPWFAYVGLRPGFAFLVGAPGSRLLVGLWTYVRWDVLNQGKPVTFSGTTTGSGNFSLGKANIGATVRVGIDF